jgi:hypothetical protein
MALTFFDLRSTHSHLTDLADREEKDEITEVRRAVFCISIILRPLRIRIRLSHFDAAKDRILPQV